MFKINDSIFDRPITEKTNFVSIYYLEYGDSKDDLRDVSAHVARREKVCRAGFGNMKLLSKESPKFAFPYSDHIVMLEISSERVIKVITNIVNKLDVIFVEKELL